MTSIRIPHGCPAWVEALVVYRDAADHPCALSYGGGTARWWNLAEGPAAGSSVELEDSLHPVSLSVIRVANGRSIAVACSTTEISRWDLATGQMLGPAVSIRYGGLAPSGPQLAVIATPQGGVIVSSGFDGALIRHDLATGALVDSWTTPHKKVWSLAAVTAPDGTILVASGGRDSIVRFWDATTSAPWGRPVEQCGMAVQIVPAVLADTRVVVAIANARGNVHRRDVATGERIGPKIDTGWDTGNRRGVCPISIAWLDTDYGPMVATCIDARRICLWDAISGEPVGAPVDTGGGRVTALAAADDHLVVGDSAGNVSRYNPTTGGLVGDIVRPHGVKSHSMRVVAMPDGQLVLAVESQGLLRRFDARTGAPVGNPYRPADVETYSLVTVPVDDGRTLLVSAGEDGIVRMDLASGTVYAASPEDRSVPLWDVTALVRPDGRAVIAAAGHDGKVYRWDAATSTPLGQPLLGHPTSVKALTSVSRSDIALIISGCEAGQVRRWDATTGEPIGEPLQGTTDMISSLATIKFANGLDVLVGVDVSGGLHQWDPWTGSPLSPPIAIPTYAHLIQAWVDADNVPWTAMHVPYTDSVEASIQLWRLDTGERSNSDATGFGTVYRDGPRTLTVSTYPDGSLVVTGSTTPN